jgi:carboxypeptidase Q
MLRVIAILGSAKGHFNRSSLLSKSKRKSWVALDKLHYHSVFKFLLLVLIAGKICRAQDQPSPFTPELLQTLRQLQQTARSNNVDYEVLEHVSDQIGPRLSGSPQETTTVDYMKSQFQRLGLKVSEEAVKVPHWVRGDERAELVSFAGMVPGARQKVVITALGGSVPTPPQGITAPIVIVQRLEDLGELAPDTFQGKIVLFDQAFDTQLAHAGFPHEAYVRVVRHRVGGATKAAQLGAVASLVRSIGSANFRLVHTGSVIYSGDRRIPAGAISSEDADLIERLSRNGPVVMHLVLTPKILPDVTSANVIADLRGSRFPEQVILVSAHLDSWDLGTGALDDGAGLGIIFQAAQAMTSLHLSPLRTIRFMAWTNEEQGGSGYYKYIDDHKSDVNNHIAALHVDVGTCHPVGYTTDASARDMKMLQSLASVLQAQDAPLAQSSNQGSDLTDYGVVTFDPLVDFRNYYDYHHTAADTLDKADLKGLHENSALIAVLAYALGAIEPRVSLK